VDKMEGTAKGMDNVRMKGEEELEGHSIQNNGVDDVVAVEEEEEQQEKSDRQDFGSDDLAQVQEDTQDSHSDNRQAKNTREQMDVQSPLCISYDHRMDVYEHESRRLAQKEGPQNGSPEAETGGLRFCFQIGLDPLNAVVEHTRCWDQDPWRHSHEVSSIEHWADIQRTLKFHLSA